jgi:hypothetical protein
MKAMKFRVESPEQSSLIQERLFEMGYEWNFSNTSNKSNKTISYIGSPFILAKDGRLTHCSDGVVFSNKPHQLTTIQDIQWQPKQGEMIEVSHSGTDWEQEEFFCMDGKIIVCKSSNYTYPAFNYARPINTIQREIDELQAKIDELKKRL